MRIWLIVLVLFSVFLVSCSQTAQTGGHMMDNGQMMDEDMEEEMEDNMGTGMMKEMMVEGDEFSFKPATVTVSKGDTVKLTFKNVGAKPHTWTIDELDVNTGSIKGGQSKTIEFVASEAGEFEVYCAVPGHKEAGMVGKLAVS